MKQSEMKQPDQPQTRRDIEARIIAKAWKDESYKQELLTNPKAIFEQEFGVQLPAEINVEVLEENSTSLHFVLPMRPEISGQELNEEELEAIAGGKLDPKALAATATRFISLLTVSGGFTLTGI